MRELLYPLGFLASVLFAARFFVQWLQSEKKGESTVSRAFWRISFLAHFMMCIHSYIQIQYPICLIQALNACIAWRNLNLMGRNACRLSTTIVTFFSTASLLTLLFFLQGESEWMRPPTLPWSHTQAIQASFFWHLVGFFGMALFASRYWLQWWLAEKHRKSFLGKSFWWISCIGAVFSLSYALRLNDPVNVLGFSIGLIPYIRNLMLFKKKGAAPAPKNRLLSKLALLDKISSFCADFMKNFESMCVHMVEKFCRKDAKKGNFSNQMEFRNISSLFLFAGEQSGDLLGGNLISSLKTITPELDIYGVGGSEMQKAGLRVIHPMERFQVMGFSDVLRSLPRLLADFRKIQREILRRSPDGVVLIDYPDFNMLLARSLRKKGYQGKVIHYVCPSVWAWRKKRVFSLAKTLDRLLTILPFEEKCFHKTKLPVTYVGHPLVSVVDNYQYDNNWKVKAPVIAIFPGSRRHEIEHNLPLQLEAAKKLGPGFTLAVSVARPELKELIEKHVAKETVLVPSEKRYELMRMASCALATSGTITLELGLHSVPTVITYKLANMNYLLGRYIFRIHLRFYTLVNIICDKEVYPEFIHKDLSSTEIFQALKRMIDHPDICHQECARLRQLLTTHNASLNAAHTITQEIR